MPVYLKAPDDLGKLLPFDKVLIIPCRFCPAASCAISADQPYFEFHRHGLKTAAYEGHIASMQAELAEKGVQAHVFKSRWIHQFVVCMWTGRRRQRLRKRAKHYDALVVLGCEAAAQTIVDALDDLPVPVIQGMRTAGIMSILPRFQWPGGITLQLKSITPLLHREQGPPPWQQL